jgi:hypothetical protein
MNLVDAIRLNIQTSLLEKQRNLWYISMESLVQHLINHSIELDGQVPYFAYLEEDDLVFQYALRRFWSRIQESWTYSDHNVRVLHNLSFYMFFYDGKERKVKELKTNQVRDTVQRVIEAGPHYVNKMIDTLSICGIVYSIWIWQICEPLEAAQYFGHCLALCLRSYYWGDHDIPTNQVSLIAYLGYNDEDKPEDQRGDLNISEDFERQFLMDKIRTWMDKITSDDERLIILKQSLRSSPRMCKDVKLVKTIFISYSKVESYRPFLIEMLTTCIRRCHTQNRLGTEILSEERTVFEYFPEKLLELHVLDGVDPIKAEAMVASLGNSTENVYYSENMEVQTRCRKRQREDILDTHTRMI